MVDPTQAPTEGASNGRPPRMSSVARAWDALAAATKTTWNCLFVALSIAAAGALIAGPIDIWLYETFSHDPPRQEDLIKVILSWSGVAIVAEIFWGPIAAAAAVYCAWRTSRGKSASLYDAVNFALNRYRRVFLPHLGAQLSIQLGMLVLIPGILFLLMYAFVDPVACLEDEEWPMDRSKKLTRGRRATLFLVALPFLTYGTLRSLFIDLPALGGGPAVFIASYGAGYLLTFWLWAAFTHLYLQRTAGRRPA